MKQMIHAIAAGMMVFGGIFVLIAFVVAFLGGEGKAIDCFFFIGLIVFSIAAGVMVFAHYMPETV